MLKKIIILVISLFSFGTLAANHQDQQHSIQKILDYWFDDEHQTAPLFNRELWWSKDQKVDNEIRLRFQSLRDQAVNQELNAWLNSPKGTLAYVILIDQFSRNLYRNTPKMYEQDPLALTASKMAIEKHFDQQLSLTERVFLYLPLEHSENIDDQNQSVALFEKLAQDAPSEAKTQAQQYLQYAKDHQEIIQQFHRFPHRNKALSRESTPAEVAFLKTHPGF